MLAYWLTPSANERAFFSATIRALAEQYGASLFAPHVTLYGSENDRASAPAALAQAAAAFEQITLEVDGIACSDELAKTVFVQFKPSDGLSRLSALFRSASRSGDNYDLNPHLSLIYQDLPMATKLEIGASVILPFKEVLFDRIQAVELPGRFRKPADVQTWKVIAVESLR